MAKPTPHAHTRQQVFAGGCSTLLSLVGSKFFGFPHFAKKQIHFVQRLGYMGILKHVGNLRLLFAELSANLDGIAWLGAYL